MTHLATIGPGVDHLDVAVIDGMAFIASDIGIFKTDLSASGFSNIINLDLYAEDESLNQEMTVTQIEAGNFDDDDDLELAVIDSTTSLPVVRIFDVDKKQLPELQQLFVSETVPNATELLTLPGSVEQALIEDGNIGADDLMIGIGASEWLKNDDGYLLWDGSIILYDDTSL